MKHFTTKYFNFDTCSIIYLFITEFSNSFTIHFYLGEEKHIQGFSGTTERKQTT
jgi:hypothetical protein